jgi:hypothetical protein
VVTLLGGYHGFFNNSFGLLLGSLKHRFVFGFGFGQLLRCGFGTLESCFDLCSTFIQKSEHWLVHKTLQDIQQNQKVHPLCQEELPIDTEFVQNFHKVTITIKDFIFLRYIRDAGEHLSEGVHDCTLSEGRNR